MKTGKPEEYKIDIDKLHPALFPKMAARLEQKKRKEGADTAHLRGWGPLTRAPFAPNAFETGGAR